MKPRTPENERASLSQTKHLAHRASAFFEFYFLVDAMLFGLWCSESQMSGQLFVRRLLLDGVSLIAGRAGAM